MIRKILVSQPRPSSEKSPYFDLATKYGVEVVFRPFIKVERLTPREFRKQKVSILDYTAIVFTSRTAVDHFFGLCQEMRVELPETMKYFGISEAIALYIQKYVQYRKRKVFFGSTGKWPELVTVMAKHKAERYLIPMSDVHDGKVEALLNTKNIKHTECVMYRTVSNDFTPEEKLDYDMLIFFSPTGIASLLKNFPNYEQGKMVIGCFGASTAQAVRDAGLRLDLEAPSEKSPSITGALDLYLKENNQ